MSPTIRSTKFWLLGAVAAAGLLEAPPKRN
jgi:hypothetical protein